MDLSGRNKKVALARWKKVFERERNGISTDKDAALLKIIICGFLAGDGSVQIRKEKDKYHFQIDFFPDDEMMVKVYCDAMASVYHKKPSIRRRDNVFHVRLTSRTIVEDIRKLAAFGIKNWSIPDLAQHEDIYSKAWLKAFFSAEGYVGKNSIKVQTVNRNGMSQVSELLKKIKIEHKFYKYEPKKATESTVFIILILKKQARELYLNEIGFWQSRKNTALMNSLNL